MLKNIITKKFAKRVINYIIDNWEICFVLDQLVYLSVEITELHNMMNEISSNTTTDRSRDHLNKLYKDGLFQLVLQKEVIIDM